MKKYLIFSFAIFMTILIAVASDEAFYSALQTCSPYSDGGQVNTEGMNVTFKNQILGKEGDKCVYKEYVSFSGTNSCTTCKLNQKQIDELVNVMKAYSTVQKYSGETVDTSSLSKVQNNPVFQVWNKYLQDSSVCTTSLPK